MGGLPSQLRIAGFPGRYLQGPGALAALPELARELGGRRLLVVSDDTVQAALGARLGERLDAASVSYRRLRFGGECTRAAIDALVGEASRFDGDTVVALGGGKTIDSAKGVAKALGTRLVVVPTIASNDSATSRLIVLYDDAHRVSGVDLLPRNPDAVLVDTAEIARAPLRFFRAGIGDALSKAFEAAQCRQAGGLNFHGGRPPALAELLGQHCHDVLRARGAAAIEAVSAGIADAAVEEVVEVTVLLSGLAFESGGLSVAHSMIRGLSAVPALGGALHGEMVSFGTLVQLVLEGRDAAWLERHLDLLGQLGLPATLAALGKASLSAGELDVLSRAALAAPYMVNFVRRVSPAELTEAILLADSLGHGNRR